MANQIEATIYADPDQDVMITANPLDTRGQPTTLDGGDLVPALVSGDAQITNQPGSNAVSLRGGVIGDSVISLSPLSLGLACPDQITLHVIARPPGPAVDLGLVAGTPTDAIP